MSNSKPIKKQRVRFEEVTPANTPVAFFEAQLKPLAAWLQLPIFDGYDDLDEMQFTFLNLPSGHTVTVQEYEHSPRSGVNLYIDNGISNISEVVFEACQKLEVPRSKVIWFHPDFQSGIDQLYTEYGEIPETKKAGTSPQNIEYESIVTPSVIDCFNHALQIYPRQQFPEYWAMLQHNLGLAYFHRNQDDRQDNLEKSIECFNKSLEIYTQQEFPTKWQINQDDLQESLRTLEEIKDSPAAIDHPAALSRETLGAFIIAIARQVRPFPTDLQTKIHELGQLIQANAQLLEQPIKLIRPLLATYPTLQLAYNQARVELEQNNSYRSKGGSIEVIKESTTAEITNSFKIICTADNSFVAAQKALKPDTNLFRKIQQLLRSGQSFDD
jgi:tetratricopeptide (TPR) repeat protein